MFAGAYLGIGIILIFSVGQPVDASLRRLVMGASFGIALTFIVFVGAELFTNYTMYMSIGLLCRRVGKAELAETRTATWLGNLAGSTIVAALFVAGGQILKPGALKFLMSPHTK